MGTIEQALLLGVEVPSYRRAAEHFSALTHVSMSKSSMQRLVSDTGKRLVEIQEAEAEAMVRVPTKEEEVTWREVPEPDSEMMNVSIDGVFINLREEGWKEVKVATISAVELEEDVDKGKEVARLTHHTYRAGVWEAAAFAKQQWAESCARGVEKAKIVTSINDGAAWIWNIVLMCYAPCIEILDWWHAVQRLWTIAHNHFGAESSDAAAWVKAQKALLANSDLRQILRHIRQLYPRHQPLPDSVRKAVAYLFKNRRRMHYKQFRQTGCPIGSGSVESACKVVVQERMKQAGMRWSRQNAQAMLALRSALLSNRWQQSWRFLAPP